MQTNDGKIDAGQVASFYDKYSVKQLKIGVNLRHYFLFNKLKSLGLKKNHKVLEVGCGIGAFTGLLCKYLKNGKIVATDISEENTRLAYASIQRFNNAEFFTTDMTDFNYNDTFDFITLLDVIEHIPIDQHKMLFSVLSKHMHKNSIILLNIPSPQLIEYYQKKSPEKLQVIDQAIYSNPFALNVEENNLMLTKWEMYSLYHHQHDYVLATIKPNVAVECFSAYSKARIVIKKLLYRLRYIIASLF